MSKFYFRCVCVLKQLGSYLKMYLMLVTYIIWHNTNVCTKILFCKAFRITKLLHYLILRSQRITQLVRLLSQCITKNVWLRNANFFCPLPYSMHIKLTKMLATNQCDAANWFMLVTVHM